MQTRATCTARNGETVIDVTFKAYSVQDAIATAARALNREFEFCFAADNWQTVQITIERGNT